MQPTPKQKLPPLIMNTQKRNDRSSLVRFLSRASIRVTTSKVGDSIFAPLLASAPKQTLYLAAKLGLSSSMAQLLVGHPEIMRSYFSQVKRFCLFLATARSGHSIMAHLLTAHPKVQICDELAAVSFFENGYSLGQVASLIKLQDYRYVVRNRKKSGYNYKIDGVWQNMYEKYPEVIGDAKGARTINLISDGDGFLPHLRATLQIPIRVIVHVRNPFDAISTRSRKRDVELHRAIEHFIKKERLMTAAFDNLAQEERLIQRHEDVIEAPEENFIRMFEFLGVDPIPEVVAACAGKIWKKPNLTRKKINWPKEAIDRLEKHLEESRLFHSYRTG